jgi:hypothetical protein|tara:strand:+ start:71 stop:196 length:126 start_codon:yes stop_codon:yes gene_type:complete
MIKTKENKIINVLKEANFLCKELDFTVGILKSSIAEERKKN